MSSSSRPAFEDLVPRFGEYLLEKGAVTPVQVRIALEHQAKQKKETGESQPLGQTLVDLGYINEETREKAAFDLILQYRLALESANIHLEERISQRTRELENSLVRLTELDAVRSNLMANISHELRTPLTQIMGYAQLLREGAMGAISADASEAVDVVWQASQRLGRLIDNLLAYTMNDRDGVKLAPTNFSLAHLAQSVLLSLQTTANQKKITLHLDSPANLAEVLADPDQIRWVIQELCENALKFTPAGGTVRLTLHQQNKLVFLDCTDTGIGIPAERIPEIFEPFRQLDGSASRSAGGTGMGLTLARKIVQAHASDLSVTSQPGKGTRFSFYLPVAADIAQGGEIP